ncbi:MAG: PIN domain-containing protein [Pseudomonadota bacterium]
MLRTSASPRLPVTSAYADPGDDAVIACAVSADADFIITGDPHLLKFKTHYRIEIVSPAEYLERFYT